MITNLDEFSNSISLKDVCLVFGKDYACRNFSVVCFVGIFAPFVKFLLNLIICGVWIETSIRSPPVLSLRMRFGLFKHVKMLFIHFHFLILIAETLKCRGVLMMWILRVGTRRLWTIFWWLIVLSQDGNLVTFLTFTAFGLISIC